MSAEQATVGQRVIRLDHAYIFCGWREWRDGVRIRQVMADLPGHPLIIHGGCRGADILAGDAAEYLRNPVIVVPYIPHLGKAGGPARNELMLDLLLALRMRHECVIGVRAFHPNILASKGTRNMVDLAKKAGVLTGVYAK